MQAARVEGAASLPGRAYAKLKEVIMPAKKKPKFSKKTSKSKVAKPKPSAKKVPARLPGQRNVSSPLKAKPQPKAEKARRLGQKQPGRLGSADKAAIGVASRQAEKPETVVESQDGSDFSVKIENVVAFVSLGKPIPLTKLVNAVENAEYEPEQFPGLVYRTTEPRAAALIFSSGKIVCTGAKSIEKAHEAIAKVVQKIREAGIPMPKSYSVKVENIVASSKIHAKLNLEEITFSLENAEYEPEQFPGLVYRISEPRVAFLLFNSGKIICTGAHNIEDIHAALGKLRDKLKSIGIEVQGGE